MTKSNVLEELLGDHKISSFSRSFINRSGNTEEQVRRVYGFFVKIGLSDRQIASQAQLLGRDIEVIARNYGFLVKIGLSDKKIASRAELLGRSPARIGKAYERLKKLGLSDEQITSRAQLLGQDQKTIERNYQHHIGLLRQNCRDRESGRDLVRYHSQILGNSPETMNANVQYLYSLGLEYTWETLLGTTPQLKRKKMAWLLREVFDYPNSEDKRKTIYEMYDFIRANPKYLTYSTSYLERAKDKIKRRRLSFSLNP